jgi:hypothetical protein
MSAPSKAVANKLDSRTCETGEANPAHAKGSRPAWNRLTQVRR